MQRSRRSLAISLLIPLLIALALFVPGINWGLPNRSVDPYLFGDTPVWSGQKIYDLSGGWDVSKQAGADVDADPLQRSREPVVLNTTDEQRAQIIQRYRIQSYQPDEHITFRALSQMSPGQFRLDPKLYQYGGLWIYPVGVMLKLGAITGLVDVRADVPFYLDQPEAFGRFYVVARSYTLLWALAGVVVVFLIVERLSSSLAKAAIAATLYACLPVVVNAAHEAKPHLPGTILMLLAALAAAKFVETGKRGWCTVAGALCGGAFGMVISALVVFSVIPVMVMLRADSWQRQFRDACIACFAGAAVYCATNPFVPINLLFHRELLASNLSNSTAMYGVSPSGVLNALRLSMEAMSFSAILVGMISAMLMSKVIRRRETIRDWIRDSRASLTLLLCAPALVIAVQFVLLAADKPAEYARFGLYLFVVLSMLAVTHLSLHRSPTLLVWAGILLLTAWHGLSYTRSFVLDARDRNSRLRAARGLEVISANTPIGVFAEPAPYTMPPANLFDRELLLLPCDVESSPAGVELTTIEPLELRHDGQTVGTLPPLARDSAWPFATPISWANRSFVVEPQR